MDLERLFSDELPRDAAAVIEQFELAVEELRQNAVRQTARIRQEVEEQISVLQIQADQQIAELEQ
jgi:hypothetical protein